MNGLGNAFFTVPVAPAITTRQLAGRCAPERGQCDTQLVSAKQATGELSEVAGLYRALAEHTDVFADPKYKAGCNCGVLGSVPVQKGAVRAP